MNSSGLVRAWLSSAVIFACCIGCGGGDGLPDTVDAGGIVTYNGDPLPEAHVIFRVKDGRLAQATTGPNGRFKLRTFKVQDGAIPGEHTVTVSKTLKAEVGDPGNDPSQGESMEAAATAAEKQAEGPEAAAAQSVIPTRYADPETSQLKFTVSESGDNDFEIELVD